MLTGQLSSTSDLELQAKLDRSIRHLFQVFKQRFPFVWHPNDGDNRNKLTRCAVASLESVRNQFQLRTPEENARLVLLFLHTLANPLIRPELDNFDPDLKVITQLRDISATVYQILKVEEDPEDFEIKKSDK